MSSEPIKLTDLQKRAAKRLRDVEAISFFDSFSKVLKMDEKDLQRLADELAAEEQASRDAFLGKSSSSE